MKLFATTAKNGEPEDENLQDEKINEAGSNYTIFENAKFSEIFKTLACAGCHHVGLVAKLCERRGFALKVIVQCPECNVIQSQVYTSSRLQENLSTRPGFVVNRLMVESFLHSGNGYAAMEKWGETLGIDVMARGTYNDCFKKIVSANEKHREAILKASREAVRKVYEAMNPSLEGKVIDIPVSYDGSYHTRGHTSLFGIGVVIDVLTGLVLDYYIVSKYCHLCAMAKSEMGEDSPEYNFWEEGHKKYECNINFHGYSGGMEQFAAEIMWKRSVSECNMRYTTMLSDGDAKTHAHLNSLEIYGKDVKIEKEECVNHVSKRLAYQLDKLAAEVKTKFGVNIGGQGEGKLKKDMIPSLQTFYRLSIVRNAPDVDAMRKDIMATLKHCSSTDAEPNHEDCPPGANSWCLYNRYKATGEKEFKHSKMDVKLSKETVMYMEPVYEHLSSRDLLERCVRAGTQNSNESLHSTVWSRCPKTIFASRHRIETAALIAIGEFNMGSTAFQRTKAKSMGAQSNSSAKISERRDIRRLKKAEWKLDHKKISKRVRATMKATMKRKEKQTEKDDLYGPGIEDDFGKNKTKKKTPAKKKVVSKKCEPRTADSGKTKPVSRPRSRRKAQPKNPKGTSTGSHGFVVSEETTTNPESMPSKNPKARAKKIEAVAPTDQTKKTAAAKRKQKISSVEKPVKKRKI